MFKTHLFELHAQILYLRRKIARQNKTMGPHCEGIITPKMSSNDNPQCTIAICVLSAQSGVLPLDRERLPRDTITESKNSIESGNTRCALLHNFPTVTKKVCQLLQEGYTRNPFSHVIFQITKL